MAKITLNFLKNKIDYSGKYPVLIWKGELRTPKIIAKYKLEKEIITKEWISFKDYIQVKFLNYRKRNCIDNSGKIRYYATNKTSGESKRFKLEINKFPYEGFDHQILWIAYEKDIEKALNFAFEEYKDKDYIHFQNSPQNQSVKGLTHFHFLTLKKIYEKTNL